MDFSSDHSLELIRQFSEKVNSEKDVIEDDKGRWDISRIQKYKFDEGFYYTVDDEIANMTFNKWYGDYLRVGINSYTLKKFRSVIFRPLWKKNGYLDRSHEMHHQKCRGYFCSYYAKNNKIKSVVKMLEKNQAQRSFSFGGKGSGWLNKFTIINKEPITFRYVPQYISYANNIGDEATNHFELLEILRNDKV